MLRFISGIGLAGQLGSAITLVSELAEKEKRGYYNTVIADLGLLGAIFASLLSFILHWRTMYFIGGVLGLILLLLRYNTVESEIFKEKDKILKKESLLNKIKNSSEFLEYIKNMFMIFTRYIRILVLGIADIVSF
jgi:MFS family permease